MSECTIRLDGISKVYSAKGASVRALDGVNVEFGGAGLVLITGENGCGKSTLLNIIGGLDRPTQGTVEVSGVKEGHKLCERAKNTGYVFQTSNLISTLTVRQNLELCAESADAVTEAMKKTGIEELADRMPAELSIGQQQRACIGRAIVKKGSILLADEPTSSLDPEMRKEIASLLSELAKEKLVIVVTHYPEDFKDVNRHIVMSAGKIISDATEIKFLPFKTADVDNEKKGSGMRFAMKSTLYRAKKHWIRFAVNLLMLVVGIACIIVGENAFSYMVDTDKAFRHAASLDSVMILTDDYSAFGDTAQPVYERYDWTEFPEPFRTKYDKELWDEVSNDYGYVCRYYDPYFADVSVIKDKKLAAGRMPEREDEIVINKYLADMYISYCKDGKYSSYSELANGAVFTLKDYGMPIQKNAVYRIVGITDDDLSAYESLKSSRTAHYEFNTYPKKEDPDTIILYFELVEALNSTIGAVYAKDCGTVHNAVNGYYNSDVNWSSEIKKATDLSGSAILNYDYDGGIKDVKVCGNAEGAVVNFDSVSDISAQKLRESGKTEEEILQEAERLLPAVKGKDLYFSMLYYKLKKTGGMIEDLFDPYSKYYYFDVTVPVTGIYIPHKSYFEGDGAFCRGGEGIRTSVLLLSDKYYNEVNSAYHSVPTGGYAILSLSDISGPEDFKLKVDENPHVISYEYIGMTDEELSSDNIAVVGWVSVAVGATMVIASLLFMLYSLTQYFKLYSADTGILMSLGKRRGYCIFFLLGEYMFMTAIAALVAIPLFIAMPVIMNLSIISGVAVRLNVFSLSFRTVCCVAAYFAVLLISAFAGCAAGLAKKTPVERIKERN